MNHRRAGTPIGSRQECLLYGRHLHKKRWRQLSILIRHAIRWLVTQLVVSKSVDRDGNPTRNERIYLLNDIENVLSEDERSELAEADLTLQAA